MRALLMMLFMTTALSAHAGYVELGASGNYRRTGYNQNNFTESISYTGSVSYYFWESCAIEISYTTGYSKQVTKGSLQTDPKETIEDNMDLVSSDIVLSPSGRQDPIRPYVKIGGGYLKKERFRRINSDAETWLSGQEGLVPSGGAGIAMNISKELSLKVGLEAWTSPLSQATKENPVIIDYAGRAGLSWIF